MIVAYCIEIKPKAQESIVLPMGEKERPAVLRSTGHFAGDSCETAHEELETSLEIREA